MVSPDSTLIIASLSSPTDDTCTAPVSEPKDVDTYPESALLDLFTGSLFRINNHDLERQTARENPGGLDRQERFGDCQGVGVTFG